MKHSFVIYRINGIEKVEFFHNSDVETIKEESIKHVFNVVINVIKDYNITNFPNIVIEVYENASDENPCFVRNINFVDNGWNN